MPLTNENQTLFLKKLSQYLYFATQKRPALYYRNDVAARFKNLKQGHCSGIVALWFYYKHTAKESYFYNSIIMPILTWDSREETLTPELEDTMEYALSTSVSLQGEIISSMTAYTDTPFEHSMVQQTDYEVLIGLLKEDHYPHLRKEYEIAFVFKNKELQSLLEEFLPGKLIKLASSDHALGLFFDGQEYILFDPNGFVQEETDECFFEKRFAANQVEDLVKNIQNSFFYPADSNLTGLTISVFDDVDKPMPVYTDRVKKIRNILYNRISHGEAIDLDASNAYDNASALWFCAARGDLDVVTLLLNRGTTHQQTNQLSSPLHIATQNGHLDVVRALLNTNLGSQLVNIQKKNNNATALHAAVENGHIEIVKLLLSRGARADIETKDSANSIHIAAKNGHNAILELLLDSNVGSQLINTPIENGDTPLYLAAMEGRTETVKLLLSYGARVDIQNKDLANPVHIAANQGYCAILELLLNSNIGPQLINTPMKGDITPLYLAAMEGKIQAVKLLLSYGAKADIKINNSTNAIHIAIENGHDAVLELLLDSNIEPDLINTPMEGGITPLYLAAMKGRTETVKLLLSRGARADIKINNSSNVMHITAQEGYSAILELLLNNNIGSQLIDIPLKNGATPLYLAAMKGRTEIVKLLLNRGAQLDKVANKDVNSIHIAAKNGHLDVIRALLNTNLGQQLLNAQMEGGATALYIAAINGHLELVKLLLNHRAKVHIANPMNIVLKNGRKDILVVLQQAKLQQENLKKVQKNIIPTTVHITETINRPRPKN